LFCPHYQDPTAECEALALEPTLVFLAVTANPVLHNVQFAITANRLTEYSNILKLQQAA